MTSYDGDADADLFHNLLRRLSRELLRAGRLPL
jgi:hypothetical protein